jgi:hypothetical protein
MFTLQNTGPTKILVLHFAMKSEIAKDLQPEPFFEQMTGADFILRAEDKHSFMPSAPITVDENGRRDLENGTAHLWVYGLVKYQDLLDEWHELGFCFRWDAAGGFVLEKRDYYTYHKHQRKYA